MKLYEKYFYWYTKRILIDLSWHAINVYIFSESFKLPKVTNFITSFQKKKKKKKYIYIYIYIYKLIKFYL